jgi:surfeit locus 1 family protein
MPRFLFTRRWVLGHLLVLVIIAGCVVAGFWQLDRLHQRRIFNARVARQLRLAPEPLQSLVPSNGKVSIGSLAYRRVEVEGTYDPRHEVVLVARVLGEQNGNHVLTPLVMSGGEGLIVDRGWVPFELTQPPVQQAGPPVGPVRLAGVLFPPEATTTRANGSPRPQVTKVDLGLLAHQMPYPIWPVYLWLQGQAPAQPGTLPTLAPLPDLTASPPHLSYAIQWFTFATIGLVGYPLLLRREIHQRSSPGPISRVRR